MLDEVDEAIIGLLHEDGRRPYGEIGRAVGLSEAATRQRVNRMREAGLLRIVAFTDPLRVGQGVVALIGLRVVGDVRQVAARLAEVQAIEYVVLTAGSFDLMVEVVCESQTALLDLINDHIRPVEGVRETETFVYLSIEKQVFAWGRRFARGAASPQNP